ncbi:hypothetical protein Bca101_072021 [Brassica carinata]|uniref:Uncharacterized protein n=1 Tax=Brassica oleracea TaxID=3712 RepID=A0A3P6H2R7_BRAOL|nr:unnamed protein product [Brassica oleracea]
MGRSELLVSLPTSPSFMDFLLNPPCLRHLFSSCLSRHNQDDHERVENDQGQLLDAMDEYIFILKRLNNRLDRSSSSAWKWHGSELELVRKLEPSSDEPGSDTI